MGYLVRSPNLYSGWLFRAYSRVRVLRLFGILQVAIRNPAASKGWSYNLSDSEHTQLQFHGSCVRRT